MSRLGIPYPVHSHVFLRMDSETQLAYSWNVGTVATTRPPAAGAADNFCRGLPFSIRSSRLAHSSHAAEWLRNPRLCTAFTARLSMPDLLPADPCSRFTARLPTSAFPWKELCAHALLPQHRSSNHGQSMFFFSIGTPRTSGTAKHAHLPIRSCHGRDSPSAHPNIVVTTVTVFSALRTRAADTAAGCGGAVQCGREGPHRVRRADVSGRVKAPHAPHTRRQIPTRRAPRLHTRVARLHSGGALGDEMKDPAILHWQGLLRRILRPASMCAVPVAFRSWDSGRCWRRGRHASRGDAV